jgi:hypothetical protein
MTSHLIIGLGGTGGKIIRSFRKTIYQEFREEDPKSVHIGYLYIDSSEELMDLNDPTWKVLGHSVQLGRNSQLKIGGADLQTILDNVHNYPGIRPWIGDRKMWKDILSSIVGETLGGQKRRLGRFLFANQAETFRQRIRNLINDIQHKSGQSAVTFHLLCGLAGGTGSGSLLDVIAQIRELGFAQQDLYRIIVYALLPDDNPPQNWDTGNYHANGYAALTELNALSVGAFNPHDITGTEDRISVRDPFNGCYVFTNRNENGMAVDVDKAMPEIMADFLYQKIVAVAHIEEWPRRLQKMENAENGDGTPETAPGSKRAERSKRFMTFGIKRLAVPEEEILEYMTYNFTSQASLQLLYNNWQDGLGFVDEPKNVDFKEYVQQNDVQLKWRMKDDHLCLSAGILEGDAGNKKWAPIPDEWNDFINETKLFLRESVDKAHWPDKLEEECRRRFAETYRSLGVAAFYDTKLKARKEMAKEICRRIEADLFDDWRTGVRSMHEISRLMEDLVSVTEDRHKGVEQQKSKFDGRLEKAEKQIEQAKRDWANVGLIKRAFGKRSDIFDNLADALQERYICRTWLLGWDFAKKLLEEFKEELSDLKGEVDDGFSRIRQADNRFRAQIASRCNDNSEGDLRKHLIRYYNPETVRAVTDRFVRDDGIQKNQTSGVRSILVKKMGEQPGFRAFNKHISDIRFMDTLEAECEKSVKRNHDLIIQNTREKLLGVSIVERLKNQFGANTQELRSYMLDLVKYAGNYVSFSELEKNKKAEGIPAAPSRVTEFNAIVPKAADHSEFMERMTKAIKESRTDQAYILETESNPREITFISITNLFPLRYLEPLANLKKKYEQRVRDLGKERASLEVHLEGDGSQFPPLYVETEVDIATRGIPLLLLAKASGLLKERENKTTGARVLSIIIKDEDGIPGDPIDLGASITESPEHLTSGTVNLIEEEVVKLIGDGDYRHQARQQELIGAVKSELDAVEAERGIDDKIYRDFLTGARKANEMVKAGR